MLAVCTQKSFGGQKRTEGWQETGEMWATREENKNALGKSQ